MKGLFQKRNVLRLTSTEIVLITCCSVLTFLFIVLPVTINIINAIIKNSKKTKKRYIKNNDGQKQIIIEHFPKNDPRNKIVSNIDKDGHFTGTTEIYFKDGDKKIFDTEKGRILKNIKEKNNVATLVVGNKLPMSYGDKYGVYLSISSRNPRIDIDKFTELVKENDNIDTIKIVLNTKSNYLSGLDFYEKILNKIGNEFNSRKNIKNIIINNTSNFANRKVNDFYNKKDECDIVNIVKEQAKKNNNMNYFYQENKGEDTVHKMYFKYDKQNKYLGLAHSPYNYYSIDKYGSLLPISKEEKYDLLNANSNKLSL